MSMKKGKKHFGQVIINEVKKMVSEGRTQREIAEHFGFKEAKDKEKVTTELQLHSDQGFKYTSSGYFNLTKEYGITPSMSRRGNCYDNACAENFFEILKTECIYRLKPKTFDEAHKLIDDYIFFYNYERIQLKTKLTPNEKRCKPT